jgi:F-type H+-transporting ATPase subunit c
MRKVTIVIVALLYHDDDHAGVRAGRNRRCTADLVPIAAGFGIAIAAGLAGIGQGKVGAAACEAMARNPGARPGIQLALILGLAFIESLVLFTLVIVFAKVN